MRQSHYHLEDGLEQRLQLFLCDERKFHYLYHIRDECEKSPLLLLCGLLGASLNEFNLKRPSHYYLEDGIEREASCSFSVQLNYRTIIPLSANNNLL
jgi:hypothetical protein